MTKTFASCLILATRRLPFLHVTSMYLADCRQCRSKVTQSPTSPLTRCPVERQYVYLLVGCTGYHTYLLFEISYYLGSISTQAYKLSTRNLHIARVYFQEGRFLTKSLNLEKVHFFVMLGSILLGFDLGRENPTGRSHNTARMY